MLGTLQAIKTLNNGGIIAYPTEAVFGLGCDPDNLTAVAKILTIKQRSAEKGLILIASDFTTLQPYLKPLTHEQLAIVMAQRAEPVTWVIPALDTVSPLLRGKHNTLAIRITTHPIARELCQQFGKPLVSTSANRHNEPPCRTALEVSQRFQNELDYIVSGEVGTLEKPTEIRELLSGKVIRD